MNDSLTFISIPSLFIASVPMVVSLLILFRIGILYKHTIYVFFRMVTQLVLVGFVLTYVFALNNSLFVLAIILFMVMVSSIISLRTMKNKYRYTLLLTMFSILLGGGINLVLLTQVILKVSPWYQASYVIPLAGMIFSNCLNGISLAIDRYQGELKNGKGVKEAEKIAIQTALIPITNNFLAVGLVSLPGLMTGQILSGVSPLLAVRYQIVVLCMLFSSQFFSIFIFLQCIKLLEKHKRTTVSNLQ